MFGTAPFGIYSFGTASAQPAGEPAPVTTTVVTDFPQTFAILAAVGQPVTVTADFPQTFAILAPQLVTVAANFAQTFAILSEVTGIDLSKVSPSRIVVFEGSGSRIVIF